MTERPEDVIREALEAAEREASAAVGEQTAVYSDALSALVDLTFEVHDLRRARRVLETANQHLRMQLSAERRKRP